VADLPERESTGEAESFLRTTDLADQLDSNGAVDFSLVHADDEFLDALGAAQPDPDGTFADDRLAALLLSWRHDVDAEPIGNLVEPKLAVATVQAARAKQRHRPRLLAPLAAAAAVLAIAFAGVGLAARGAEPGDTLWGLARVLYADHARSVEAAQAVRSDLTKAEEALASGKVAEAKTMLDEAKLTLPTVANEDGKDDLQAQHAELEAKLSDNPAAGTAPPPNPSPSTVPPADTTAPGSSNPDTAPQSPPPSVDLSVTQPPSSSSSPNEPERNESTSNEAPKNEPGSVPAGQAPASEGPAGGDANTTTTP
jgi:hypothetical protein